MVLFGAGEEGARKKETSEISGVCTAATFRFVSGFILSLHNLKNYSCITGYTFNSPL